MDLLNLWRLLVRRKLVVIPMVLLSVAGLFYVYESAPPVYQSGGSVALANPKTPDPSSPSANPSTPTTLPKGADNPYARYNDLSVIVDIVVRQVSSNPVDAQMRSKGLVGTYIAGTKQSFYSGPIIDVTAEASTPEQAKKSATIVLDEIGHQLQVLQDRQQTARPYQITTLPVTQPEGATAVFSSTLRRLIMAGVLALILVIGSAVLVEAIVARRLGRRRGKADAGAQAGDAPGTDVAEAAVPATIGGVQLAAVGAAPGDVAPGEEADAESAQTWWDASGQETGRPRTRHPRPRTTRPGSTRSRANRR